MKNENELLAELKEFLYWPTSHHIVNTLAHHIGRLEIGKVSRSWNALAKDFFTQYYLAAHGIEQRQLKDHFSQSQLDTLTPQIVALLADFSKTEAFFKAKQVVPAKLPHKSSNEIKADIDALTEELAEVEQLIDELVADLARPS